MNDDWQTWTALGVVIVTAVVFALRLMKRGKGGGSCASCGSAKPITKR